MVFGAAKFDMLVELLRHRRQPAIGGSQGDRGMFLLATIHAQLEVGEERLLRSRAQDP